MAIKLYYMKTENNFGDMLSKDIVEEVSKHSVEYEKIAKADLVSTGSLFQKLEGKYWKRLFLRGFRATYVWGTGTISDGKPLKKFKLKIKAVRGKLTQKRLGLKEHECALGDPALLCSKIFPKQVTEADGKKFLVTPHLHDKNYKPWVKKLEEIIGEEVDVCLLDEDVHDVLEKISKAKGVFTTAMHPLIVSHSYAVPVLWFAPEREVLIGGNYKFQDYYSVFDLNVPEASIEQLLEGSLGKEDLLSGLENSIVCREKLNQVQQGLLDSFPYELVKKS